MKKAARTVNGTILFSEMLFLIKNYTAYLVPFAKKGIVDNRYCPPPPLIITYTVAFSRPSYEPAQNNYQHYLIPTNPSAFK